MVLREEEEVTPGGTGSAADLLFFPLPEVTFLTNLDGDEIKLPLPASLGTTRPNDSRKRLELEHRDGSIQENVVGVHIRCVFFHFTLLSSTATNPCFVCLSLL